LRRTALPINTNAAALGPDAEKFRRIFVASWAHAPVTAEKLNAFNHCEIYAALHK
jgi:hypothetical protein